MKSRAASQQICKGSQLEIALVTNTQLSDFVT